MKKLFLMCLSVICFASVYADGYKTCRVSGTTGTVVVNSFDTDDGVIVTFANDTDQYVNITAKVQINQGLRTITKMVPPHSETTVNLGSPGAESSVSSVVGSKCD